MPVRGCGSPARGLWASGWDGLWRVIHRLHAHAHTYTRINACTHFHSILAILFALLPAALLNWRISRSEMKLVNLDRFYDWLDMICIIIWARCSFSPSRCLPPAGCTSPACCLHYLDWPSCEVDHGSARKSICICTKALRANKHPHRWRAPSSRSSKCTAFRRDSGHLWSIQRGEKAGGSDNPIRLLPGTERVELINECMRNPGDITNGHKDLRAMEGIIILTKWWTDRLAGRRLNAFFEMQPVWTWKSPGLWPSELQQTWKGEGGGKRRESAAYSTTGPLTFCGFIKRN